MRPPYSYGCHGPGWRPDMNIAGCSFGAAPSIKAPEASDSDKTVEESCHNPGIPFPSRPPNNTPIILDKSVMASLSSTIDVATLDEFMENLAPSSEIQHTMEATKLPIPEGLAQRYAVIGFKPWEEVKQHEEQKGQICFCDLPRLEKGHSGRLYSNLHLQPICLFHDPLKAHRSGFSGHRSQRKIFKSFLYTVSALLVATVTPLPAPLGLHVYFTSAPLKAVVVAVYTLTTTVLYHLLTRENKNGAGYASPYVLGGIASGLFLALITGMDLEGLLLVGVGWGILAGLGCFWARGLWRADNGQWEENEKDGDRMC